MDVCLNAWRKKGSKERGRGEVTSALLVPSQGKGDECRREGDGEVT